MTHRYVGEDRTGNSRTGVTDEAPDKLAAKLYLAGWRKLRITADGAEVGGITRDENNRRAWWGATTP
jgi:hypothetical protein